MHRTLHICWIVILLSTLPLFTTGQGGAWSHYYTGNSALPDNSVRCITFENDSTAWIGTDFGLAKMVNGIITPFTVSNSGLTNNSIRSLAADRQKRKWIGTFFSGADVYDDTSWVNYSTSSAPLPDDFVRSLNIDTAGTVWMGTLGGLVRLDTAFNWSVLTMWNSILGSNNIACIHVDSSSNNKWIGTVNGGVLLIENDTAFTRYSTQNSGLSDNTVLGIVKDNFGNVFMATPANGLVVKLAGFGWLTYNLVSSNIPSAGLTSVVLDNQQRPWCGSIDRGLLLKTSGSNFVFFDTANSPLTDNYIQCLAYDHQGKIWIGTQTGGLFILDPSLLTFTETAPKQASVYTYPNPTSQFLHVDGAASFSDGEIIDASGRSVQLLSAVGSPIDVSALPQGHYLLRLREKNKGVIRMARFVR